MKSEMDGGSEASVINEYYKMKEQAFGATPDPRFLYLGEAHREALASVWFALEAGRGFAAVIAAPGMGKTTLMRAYLARLRGRARTAYVWETQANGEELLRAIVKDLGAPGVGGPFALREQVREILVREARRGRRCVVVLDEAQNLSEEALETVRLLTNFETTRLKLMQVVLAGQPSLAERLGRAELAQLRQRIGTVARLAAFDVVETRRYIGHRMKIAGAGGMDPFTAEAMERIAVHSGGIPRNINTLCFNALSLGRALGRKKIGAEEIAEVVGDLDLETIAAGTAAKGRVEAAAPAAKSGEGAGAKWGRANRGFARAVRATALAGALAVAGAVHFSAAEVAEEKGAGGEELGGDAGTRKEVVAGAGGMVVRAEKGETLRTISERYLGEKGWGLIREIVRMNPEIVDANRIEVGQEIRLPLPRAQAERKRKGKRR